MFLAPNYCPCPLVLVPCLSPQAFVPPNTSCSTVFYRYPLSITATPDLVHAVHLYVLLHLGNTSLSLSSLRLLHFLTFFYHNVPTCLKILDVFCLMMSSKAGCRCTCVHLYVCFFSCMVFFAFSFRKIFLLLLGSSQIQPIVSTIHNHIEAQANNSLVL